MKPMLQSSKARTFAETRWGTGGTQQYKTTRPGVFYFSCSGHGGYIVDSDRLTREEYENIIKYTTPEKCLVVIRGDKITFWQIPDSPRTQKYKLYTDSYTSEKQVFFFEEDCDWSILEKFTNIRRKETFHGLTSEEYLAYVESTFNRWCNPDTKVPQCLPQN